MHGRLIAASNTGNEGKVETPYAIKTPKDFRGDIFQGVDDYLKLDPLLRFYLSIDLC